jgi:hypothetical protein
VNAFKEQILRYWSHCESFGGSLEARVVISCPEQIRSRATNPVGLHAFEYLFREMQGAGAGHYFDRAVRQQLARFPLPALKSRAVHDRCGYQSEAEGIRQPEIREAFPHFIPNKVVGRRHLRAP